MRLATPYYVCVYYLSWIWFGFGGLLLNLGCALLLPLQRNRRVMSAVRSTIRVMFDFWLKWCHASGSFKVRWNGFGEGALRPGTVYISNHPTLVDAPALLSRLPEAICIFKPSLLKNPCIGPAAVMAGYVCGNTGVDLVRDAAEQVASGCSLLIFPEGTRTRVGEHLNPIKPGFALIALRANAPIRFITLRASPDLLVKGRPWWKLPDLPTWMEVTLHDEIPADTPLSAAEITAMTQERLAMLVRDNSSSSGSCPQPTRTSC